MLTIVTHAPSTLISASGPSGVGGVNGLPGVATGMPMIAAGTLQIPLQLTQNTTTVVFTLNVTGAKALVTFNVQISGPTFRFASTFGDHMVLQRAPQRANVLGFGRPGTTVKLTLAQADDDAAAMVGGITTVRPDGGWTISLSAVAAVGAGADKEWTLTATAGADIIALVDVLFGDLWICGGQSNMQVNHTLV